MSAEDADRHSWPGGSAYGPRGRRGPGPSLPEERKTEAVSQTEGLKGRNRHLFELTLYFFHI